MQAKHRSARLNEAQSDYAVIVTIMTFFSNLTYTVDQRTLP